MKTIRVLERAIAAIRAIDDGNKTLRDIHLATGIDKATLLRILQTFQNEGVLRRSMFDNSYQRLPFGSGAGLYTEKLMAYAEIATPFLQALQKEVIWPSDFLVFNKNKMFLLDTTRRFSSIGLNPRYTSGYEVDIFLSAPGRAYLAYCSDVERKKIIGFYQKTPPVNPRSKVILDKELATIIKETRDNHFGRRDHYFGGSDEDISEFDDGFDAISVPLLTKNKIFGCITLVWPRKYKLHQKIITDHLDIFKKTAAQIAQALEEVDKKLPKG